MANLNPFRFGDPVGGDHYLPRPELKATVKQFLGNGINVVLIGPRRFGKTSFILDFLATEEHAGVIPVFVDIFSVTSHRDFLLQLFQALRRKKSFARHAKDWLISLPKALRPKLTIEADPQTGAPSISLSATSADEKDVKELILQTLALVPSLGKKVILAIDEFQTVAGLDDKGWLEAALRTQMQQQKNVAYLFSGSRKSVIHEMFNGSGRPFFRSCQPIEFPAFGDEFTDWIIDRFARVKVTCDRVAIQEIRKLVCDTPNYVQMACFHLVAQGVRHVNQTAVREVLKSIVKQNAYAYQTLLNSQTLVQQRVLRLAACEKEGIFSRENLKRYEISSGAAAAGAIKALKDRQILDEGGGKGKVIFDDPLFEIWLRTEFHQEW